ncbi:class V chitinase [Citrus sinensis]|uniref:class V chitinase-like n=1 Tax=Citrus sinensis TaxID=2711 RepID=UPI0021944A55|nr:class V chitinase-like [Citrus sinensis]KAH9660246.1 class V chitinase [Citrus sinensis]
MASNPHSRKSFIDSSIKIARLYGFQGLDLSWSRENTSWDKYNIRILFKEWQAAVPLKARNISSPSQLSLTARVAYSPLSTAGAYPVDSVRQYLNWVHVITAQYSRPTRTNFTSAHAALYYPRSVSNTEYGITEWIEERLSADKLDLCLPFYGYAWTLVKPKDNGIGAAATGPTLSDNGFVPYKEIKNHIKNYGAKVQVMYNFTYMVNYCSIGKIWFGFDDVEAIRVKVHRPRRRSYVVTMCGKFPLIIIGCFFKLQVSKWSSALTAIRLITSLHNDFN